MSGNVTVQRGRSRLVVRVTIGTGSPSKNATELFARNGRTENGVTNHVVRRGLGSDLVFDAHLTEELHRTLVRDVCAGGVGRPAVLREHYVLHAETRKRQRHARSGGTRTDDDHVCFDDVLSGNFCFVNSIVEHGHGVRSSSESRCAPSRRTCL